MHIYLSQLQQEHRRVGDQLSSYANRQIRRLDANLFHLDENCIRTIDCDLSPESASEILLGVTAYAKTTSKQEMDTSI